MTTAMRDAFTRAVDDPRSWGSSLRVDINKLLAHSRSGTYGAPRYDQRTHQWVVRA